MVPDRDAQAVEFIKRNVRHRTSLSIGQNDRLANKFRLRFLERAEDC